MPPRGRSSNVTFLPPRPGEELDFEPDRNTRGRRGRHPGAGGPSAPITRDALGGVVRPRDGRSPAKGAVDD
jgi:hypothetical protein